MSDNGVLTRQAQRAMDLANALEARLVQAEHSDALALDLDDDALGRAPMDLPALLDTLVCMVSPDYGLPDPGLATDIPPSLVTKLRAAERGGETKARAVRQAAEHLHAETELSTDDVEILTNLARALEAEASALYRRLINH